MSTGKDGPPGDRRTNLDVGGDHERDGFGHVSRQSVFDGGRTDQLKLALNLREEQEGRGGEGERKCVFFL